jgi:hypothetical protein
LHRQRIFYTYFTTEGVVNIELLFSPQTSRIVSNYFTHTEIGAPNLGFTQITIHQRSVRIWLFNVNPPVSLPFSVSADITFNRPEAVRRGAIFPPGVTVVDPHTVTLAELTENPADPNVLNARPLQITLVLMTVLEPDATALDHVTEQRIRELGMRRFLEPPAGVAGPAPIPPLELDAAIWIHLLVDEMAQYRPGDIECEPAPEPRPDPEEACHQQPDVPKRGPEDQDDPDGGQREGKRPCIGWDGDPLPDLNDKPGGSGQAAGGASSSRQHHYNPQQPKATYEVPKLLPYDPPPPRLIYDIPDSHVEMQTDKLPTQAFRFALSGWLTFLFAGPVEVKLRPHEENWLRCHEVSWGGGHDGDL